MKITDKQLEKLRGFVNTINKGQAQVGAIESQKHELLHQLAQIQSDLRGFYKDLEDEYGKISISIEDGSYDLIPEKTEEA